MSYSGRAKAEINAGNINKLEGPRWKYRNIHIRQDLNLVPEQTLQEALQGLAEIVETVSIDHSGRDAKALCAVLSGLFGSPRPPRLVNLFIRNWVDSGDSGSVKLSTLLQVAAPTLEVLTLDCVRLRFSSPEQLEQFLATTGTLRTLILNDVEAVGDRTTVAEIANAVRQGLSRNQTLTKIAMAPKKDGLFLRELFLGITNNRRVQELKLYLSISPSSHTLTVFQELISGSTSIRNLKFSTRFWVACIWFFMGLSDSSIAEVELRASSSRPDDAPLDASLAGVIKECLVKNKTLQVFKVSGRLGVRCREALSDGLSQSESLKELRANGLSLSSDVLQSISKWKSVGLSRLKFPDWGLLTHGMRNVHACTLQALDLSSNELAPNVLATILPSLSLISSLSLMSCSITCESVPLLSDFIRTSQLKKLNLGYNPIRSQGATSILEAASRSTSMEHLGMVGALFDERGDTERSAERIQINECHDSLRTFLIGSRLVSLDVTRYELLGLDAIHAVADGLGVSTTLKIIKLPWLNLEFIHVLGEALTINQSLESLEAHCPSDFVARRDSRGRRVWKELSAAEEQAIISFFGMMPRMRVLRRLVSVFEFKLSDRLNAALVAALKENTVIEEIQRGRNVALEVRDDSADHLCDVEAVQFYLELNRLGRHHYLGAPETKSIPIGVLPHLFARVTKPEFSSHLFYFLRSTSPDLLAGRVTST